MRGLSPNAPCVVESAEVHGAVAPCSAHATIRFDPPSSVSEGADAHPNFVSMFSGPATVVQVVPAFAVVRMKSFCCPTGVELLRSTNATYGCPPTNRIAGWYALSPVFGGDGGCPALVVPGVTFTDPPYFTHAPPHQHVTYTFSGESL